MVAAALLGTIWGPMQIKLLNGMKLLVELEARNMNAYGNALGASVGQPRTQTKLWAKITAGTARTGGDEFDFSPPGW